MELTERKAVITAALTGTPQKKGESDAQWLARATHVAVRAAVIVDNEKHPIHRAVEQVVGGGAKAFRGTLTQITKEKSSTRGIVLIHTGTTRESKLGNQVLPAGMELLRTERTDRPDGKAIVDRILDGGMIGHKVTVWMEIEKMKNGNSLRVLRHIEDRGEDEDYEKVSRTQARKVA